MKLRQVRASVELPPLLQDDHFDPGYEESRGIYPNRKLMRVTKGFFFRHDSQNCKIISQRISIFFPSCATNAQQRAFLFQDDQLYLECTYSSEGSKTGAKEICFGTILYFPRINMTSCQSAYQNDLLSAALGLPQASAATAEK